MAGQYKLCKNVQQIKDMKRCRNACCIVFWTHDRYLYSGMSAYTWVLTIALGFQTWVLGSKEDNHFAFMI